MKTCINGATTMPYSLEEDIETAGKAGFEGVELWRSKLDRYLQNHRKEELRDLVSHYNLSVSAICFLSGYVWCDETEFARKVEETKRYLEVASYVGCESLLICAEGSKGKSREEVIDAHVQRLRRLAETCEDYGVKIELEWFQDLTDAVEIINLVSHDYVGMMVDTFHWYRGDGNIAHIDLIPKGKLFLVHMNDCENIERSKLTDKNRLYCGYGVIPLVEILKKFKEKSYDGYLSVEIFREEYWKQDPLAISLESIKSLKEVMKRAELL